MFFLKQITEIASYLKVEDGNNPFKELRRVLNDVLEEYNGRMLRRSPIPLKGRVFVGLKGPKLTKQQSDQTITKGEVEIGSVANVNRIQFSALLPPQKKTTMEAIQRQGWGLGVLVGDGFNVILGIRRR